MATKGQTGIRIVDAGMRQLWQTGYMHNRVLMIVASFLINNYLIHWKQGENGFLILCLMLTLRVIILTGNG